MPLDIFAHETSYSYVVNSYYLLNMLVLAINCLRSGTANIGMSFNDSHLFYQVDNQKSEFLSFKTLSWSLVTCVAIYYNLIAYFTNLVTLLQFTPFIFYYNLYLRSSYHLVASIINTKT